MNSPDFVKLMQGVGELVQLSHGKQVQGARKSELKKATAPTSAAPSTEVLDIKQVRESAKVTQAQFASLIGVNLNTLQNWEQRRNRPRGAAYSLLRLVAHNPCYAVRALA